MQRAACSATGLAAVAFAAIVSATPRAEAQRSHVRGPRFGALGVVRDYDGAPGSNTVALVRAPLDIVRSYEGTDAPADAVATSASPLPIAPWDGIGPIEVTAAASPAAPPSASTTLARLPLLGFDEGMAAGAGDPSVHALSVITDYDADSNNGAPARVMVTYDSSGRVTHVETALPALPVASSSPVGPRR